MKKLKSRACTQERMRNSGYRTIHTPMIFDNEEFVQISSFIPEVKDYYWISNFGRIYSSWGDCCLLNDLVRECTHTTLSKKNNTSQVYDIRELYYQAFGRYYN